ncbi:hypothetical protein [Halomonas korlensis]|nr:hypothetical protein [Halomonas korlensis]
MADKRRASNESRGVNEAGKRSGDTTSQAHGKEFYIDTVLKGG